MNKKIAKKCVEYIVRNSTQWIDIINYHAFVNNIRYVQKIAITITIFIYSKNAKC